MTCFQVVEAAAEMGAPAPPPPSSVTYDTTLQASAGSVELTFPQNVYGVSLIELTSGG